MTTTTETAGRCQVCNSTFSKRPMLRHLAECAYPAGKNIAAVTQVRVDVPRSPYWLDLDVKANAPLQELDDFLRAIWLDCCDHLSSFEVGPVRYVGAMPDGYFRLDRGQRGMDTRVSVALPPPGSEFKYEYDFGSTTELRLKVIAQRHAPSRREGVRLLARNDAPVWTCGGCAESATSICTECLEEDVFLCDAHAEEHECGEEAMAPVVNSPRMGVCGYTGGAD